MLNPLAIGGNFRDIALEEGTPGIAILAIPFLRILNLILLVNTSKILVKY